MGVKYLLPFLLSGCAFFDNPAAFEARNQSAKLIEARVVHQAELQEICKTNKELWGCAVITPNRCTIYTERYTTEEIFGHELRHCFYGQFHD